MYRPLMSQFQIQLFSFDPRIAQIKKDPSTFLKVLEIIRQDKDRCLFIDDSKTNTDNSKSVGLPTIRFFNKVQLLADLPKFGVDSNLLF